jgi:hypothetical protein
MTTIRVTDRTYKDMLGGAEFARWPDRDVPPVGERVVIFDRNLDLTQHDVLEQDGRRVRVGPALLWKDDDPLPPEPDDAEQRGRWGR